MTTRTILLAAGFCLAATAADRATITGRVQDSFGKPVQQATVIVYAAGAKVGYSTFCPTCYVDCGKRAVTDATGDYRIASLDPSLWFRLLVVRDGYEPLFVMKVDPAAGPVPAAGLTVRPAVSDPARVLRGRVVYGSGVPLRDALVRPEMVAAGKVRDRYRYDQPPQDGDRIAVTNARGEFEIVYPRPAAAMVLIVEARGMAPKRFRDVPTGSEGATLSVTDGATVRGRLLQNGQPVGGAEISLAHRNQMMGYSFDEVRIGTEADGSFVIPAVPANEVWYLHASMDTIEDRGAVQPVKVVTKSDGEILDAGDLKVVPGLRLRGRVELTDGKTIPAGMHVRIAQGCVECWEEMAIREPSGVTVFSREFHLIDEQTVPLGPDGRFEFKSLPTGPYRVIAEVEGYQLAPGYTVLRPAGMQTAEESGWPAKAAFYDSMLTRQRVVEVMVTANVDGLYIKLDPLQHP
jgi:protocatechuate 3,4-dioxygenase beta subunit